MKVKDKLLKTGLFLLKIFMPNLWLIQELKALLQLVYIKNEIKKLLIW